MVEKQKVAVIGAGPAGLAAAYQLAKAGIEVEVFEAGPSVGGMSKTITLWNQRVDLGPHHFVSKDKRVVDLWLDMVGQDYSVVNRLTRILYKNRFYYYPLNLSNVLRNLGVCESILCVLSYMRQRFIPEAQDDSFEDWVISKFGKRLFQIFFKAYSEKLWGISCQDLDADFAVQRIKQLSLFEAIKHALFQGKGNTHKSLVSQFAYPHAGAGVVYEKMTTYIDGQGGQVNCNTPVKGILLENNRAVGIAFEDGREQRYDHVISSMPLTTLVMTLSDSPAHVKAAASSLMFRNTILVYLNVNAVDLFPDNWLYVHSNNLKMGRITNFRNWVPHLYGEEKTSILVLEYWCFNDDPIWSEADEVLIAQASQEVRTTGLIQDAEILDGYVHRLHRCYPVYDRGYKERLRPVEAYLSQIEHLGVIGRYGAFKYNNQDHSILMGILAAENIIHGTKHNLWDINADYESYQERVFETFYDYERSILEK
jgi:protoporphyrinogen oxidase